MNIDKEQRFILIVAGIVIIAVIIFWKIIYDPKSIQVSDLKGKIDSIQEDLNKFQEVVGVKQDLDDSVKEYATRLRKFKECLPKQEESTLRELALKADEQNINVLSISAGEPQETTSNISIKECICRELPIYLRLKTTYVKLGIYLNIIQTEFPSVIRINKIDIKKEGEVKGEAILDVSLDVTLFMAIPV